VTEASHVEAAVANGEVADSLPRVSRTSLAGFLLGSAGMFATMYATQAILPELGRDFDVSPAEAGLTVSAVVVAIAAGVWIWGPLSDRIGRRRSLLTASVLLVAPTVGAALAPTFELLVAFRALQGLCMPGLLAVGVPYVMEAFGPRLGGRAMGVYVSALVAGGLVGRVGVALATAVVGWRWAIGGLAVLPLAGAAIMQRSLPHVAAPARSGRGVAAQLRNTSLLRIALAAAAMFFTFVGSFSYAAFRLERAPFSYGNAVSSLIFLLWVLGAVGPFAGRIADRIGWRRTALAAAGLTATGLALSLPAWTPTFALGLACVTLAMFSGVTALQLGLTATTSVDRGAASAVYFSVYYGAGAFGAYLPGLAWQAWRWPGVVAVSSSATAVAIAALLTLGARPRPEEP
jgi:YNFM family putative membrane transporter